MRRDAAPGPIAPRRSGKYLILFAVYLPVLLGMSGLTIDAGTLLAVRRQAQNAADAAALAAAQGIRAGSSPEAAKKTARNFVETSGGLSVPTTDVHIPPASGSYQKNGYAEVIVTATVHTFFIQVLGINPQQTVEARAVAGVVASPVPHQITLLDPNAAPGLDYDDPASLPKEVVVPGGIAVNSEAGLPGGPHPDDFAVRTGNDVNKPIIRSPDVQVVGEVDSPRNFKNLSGNDPNPPHTGALPVGDPLSGLATPTTSNGVVGSSGQGSYQATVKAGDDLVVPSGFASYNITTTGGRVTFNPNIYSSINIHGSGAAVTFNPGIYVLKGGTGGSSLSIETSGSVTGKGVLFYNTGSDYVSNTGGPDAADAASSSGSAGDATFGDIAIHAQNLDLSGLDSSNSTFEGILFYQRRANQAKLEITAKPETKLAGTIYAKRGKVQLNGAEGYQVQVVAGRMVVGKGDKVFGVVLTKLTTYQLRQVFLVE
jgi:Flp pilus assembly protein TadG